MKETRLTDMEQIRLKFNNIEYNIIYLPILTHNGCHIHLHETYTETAKERNCVMDGYREKKPDYG